jgi:rhomboid protease GluP
MSLGRRTAHPARAPAAIDPATFVDELCKRLVTSQGYSVLGDPAQGMRPYGVTTRDGFPWRVATVPELAPLAQTFDRVLVRSDGFTMGILCIKDRLRAPGTPTTATLQELLGVGAGCLKYTGETHGQKMPVHVEVWEVCGEEATDAHLAALRESPYPDKVGVTATSIRPATMQVWTNARLLGGLRRRRLARRLVEEVRSGKPPTAPSPIGAPGRRPIVTWTLLAALAVIFALQLLLGEWEGLLSPTVPSLIAFGALQRGLVLEAGQWYRLASAALLHANLFHIAMNGLALFFGGTLLERLIGRAWLLVVFGLSALGGSLMSMLLGSERMVSVGASGAILGLFGAALAVSFRIPHGAARTWAQSAVVRVLIPSLIPLFAFRGGGGIDYGAHLGGAVTGLLVGLFLLATWRRTDPEPRHRGLAVALAAVSALVLAAGFGKAQLERPAFAREQALADVLVPRVQIDALQASGAPAQTVATLRRRWPRDPRLAYLTAIEQVRAGASTDAEQTLRAALREDEVLRTFFTEGTLEAALRALLAQVLVGRGAADEAREAIRPSCPAIRKARAAGDGFADAWFASACGD